MAPAPPGRSGLLPVARLGRLDRRGATTGRARLAAASAAGHSPGAGSGPRRAAIAGAYLRTVRRFSRSVRLIFLGAALVWFSVMGVHAVLFNLYVLRLGYGPEFVGQVNATGLLAGSLFCLPAGELGRRFGCRRTMIAGLLLAALGYALIPLAGVMPAQARAGWLTGSYLLACLGSWSLYQVNVTPFLMGATRADEHTHAFSVFSALPTAAAFLGALVGGFLPGAFAALMRVSPASAAPYGVSLLIASVALLPAALALAHTDDVDRSPAAVAHVLPRDGRVPVALIVMMSLLLLVRAAGQGSVRVFYNVYLDEGLGVPTPLIGTIAAVGQPLAIPAALLTPILAARWGNARTYTLAALGMAASLLPLALVPSLAAAAVGYVGVISLFAIAATAVTVYGQAMVLPQWRPLMEGSVMMAVTFGWASMGYGGGYIIRTFGYGGLFLTGATMIAAGALLFWWYFRVPRGEYAVPAAAAVAGGSA